MLKSKSKSRAFLPVCNFGFRFAQAREILGLSQWDMAEELDISSSHLSRIEKGNAAASWHLMLAVEYLWGISVEWLQRGVGPMFLRQMMLRPLDDLPRDAPAIDAERFRGTDESADDFATVPILADEAAAGEPRAVRDNQILGNAVIHKRWLGGDERHFICLFVAGDSMMPILTDGSIVCVDLRVTDPKRLIDKMVAAVVDEGVTIKWLRKGRADRWALLPENREHSPFELSPKELRIVGRIAWWWCRAE